MPRPLFALATIGIAAVAFAGCSESDSGSEAPETAAEATTTEATTEATTSTSESDVAFPDSFQSGTPGTSLGSAARGTVLSCQGGTLTGGDAPWVTGDNVIDLNERPVVPGSVTWNSVLEIGVDGDERRITGNNLPDHETGTYPVPESSDAYSYYADQQVMGGGTAAEIAIEEQDVDFSVPANPEIADEPSCIDFGPIGMSTTGSYFFSGLDAANEDANVIFPFDKCLGHPAPGPLGAYHYHNPSPCMPQGDPGEHSPLVGYGLDGFGVYGPNDEGGEVITNAELDECHGHTGPVPDEAGEVYHYHFNYEFPYGPGCWMGTPSSIDGSPTGGSSRGGSDRAEGAGQTALVEDGYGHAYLPDGTVVHTGDGHTHEAGHSSDGR